MEGFWEALKYFFNSNALNPHGICLLWRPELLWTHVLSDVTIGLAYFSIPLALGVFLYHRRDVGFGWVIWMFVGFIMLCGVTHFMSVWTLWNADYGIEALLKGATAIASLATAAAMWPLLPRIIAIPSPAILQARVDERDRALGDLQRAMADMVQMKEHERRQRVLLDELNHRVKNTLASVQSIASQTARRAGNLEEFNDTFSRRLMSLASTHDLLVERTWGDASFRELLDRTLEHYGKPYTVLGPDLELHPNLAVTLGMALHELATNAVKHGAWSGDGQVMVEVSTAAEGAVCIVWRESGGPAVRPPDGKGFGTRLLQGPVAGQIGGAVEMDYAPEGLVCTIRTERSASVAVAGEPHAGGEASG